MTPLNLCVNLGAGQIFDQNNNSQITDGVTKTDRN